LSPYNKPVDAARAMLKTANAVPITPSSHFLYIIAYLKPKSKAELPAQPAITPFYL
jgi:hypothetical protein